MRAPTSRDGAAHPRRRLCSRFALPATLCFIQFGRSRERQMETKKFLQLSRQGYGLFTAKIWFKSHDQLGYLTVGSCLNSTAYT